MAFPLSESPRCVALRSKHDNSYLQLVHDESHGGSLIELGGGNGDGGVMNPRCRFYLEPSEEHEGLMHVRCCYNNKYWVPQQRVLPGGGSARWVIGTADEPEEDRSKPSCTLHKLVARAGEQQPEEDGSTCRFLHSKLGKYACVSSTPLTSIRSYMHIASHGDEDDRQDGGLIDAFSLVDVSRQKRLPSYVAFKGDNGCFITATESGLLGKKILFFDGKDIGDPRVLHSSFTNDDGVVRIKSNYLGSFWRRNTDPLPPLMFPVVESCIFPDSDDTTYDNPDTLFRVTTGDDFIALRNLGNNNYCQGHFLAPSITLVAIADYIRVEAKLQISDAAISRDIYDVDFRLSEAKMYTNGIDGLYSQTVKNNTSTTNQSTLTFTYTSTVETTWSSSVSLTVGVKTTLECGIPFVAEGKVEISAEFSGSYTWGETKTEEKQVTRDISVNVPPMKKVTVKAIGSNGVCNVPFSYTSRDVLATGEEVTQKFTDGMYCGVKTSNITFDVIEEDL